MCLWLSRAHLCVVVRIESVLNNAHKIYKRLLYLNNTCVSYGLSVFFYLGKTGQTVFRNKQIYIYICAAYISAQNSSSNSGLSSDDKFEGLRKELDWYTTIRDVAIIGDLNNRVGTIQERQIGFNMDPNAVVEITTVDYVPPRRSFGKNVNAYCRKLLLTDNDLMIINGRVWGDLTGIYTCCQRKGCSVVDMLLVQNYLFKIKDYFQIYDFDWYSDHAVISASLSIDIRWTLDMPSDWIRLIKQLMK